MILYCSNLPNDQDMIHALGSCAVPIPIDAGDCVFFGFGEGGKDISVSVERKKIGDLCQCIVNGRYLHQAQIAKESGISVLALIVEGEVRSNPDDGLLEVPVWFNHNRIWKPVQPTITYSRFLQYLVELDYLAGIIVLRSVNVQETASAIRALYTNFQTPPEAHNSLHQIYSQPTPVQLVRPSLIRKVAYCLNGIGWERSGDVAQRFKTVAQMVQATEQDWQEIEGIGKGIAGKVVRELNGLA